MTVVQQYSGYPVAVHCVFTGVSLWRTCSFLVTTWLGVASVLLSHLEPWLYQPTVPRDT